MASFSDIASLKKYLESALMNVLENEVYREIEKEIQASVVENVYDKYEPTQYERTGKMSSSKSIKKYKINGKTLMITHERMDGNKNVSQIVSSGIGYDWTRSRIYKNPFARDFMSATTYKIKSGNIHLIAMIKGLKARGISAKIG